MTDSTRLDLIPTPQYVERLNIPLDLAGTQSVRVVVAPDADAMTLLAAQYLEQTLREHVPGVAVDRGPSVQAGATCIRLVEWPAASPADLPLNVLDEQVLSSRHHGQSYILRTLDARTLLIVGSPQGLLYGVMTLVQLLATAAQDGTIPGLYIRDFPSFPHRDASCWLLNGEANRWSYDRGQGLEAIEALVRRKLDFCLRYKINMVQFDGFGFGLAQRFPEYASLMQRLNAFARQRGIRLVFGGYGAGFGMAYQPGPLYEDAPLQGTVWLNRRSYPDGDVYACMSYPRTREGLEPGVFGMCRSNDDLNRLKAEELAAYVRAVEPGALYIHHEDFGGMDTTQKYWLQRCPRCRRRWPNDVAAAADGAAGAIAHGYSCLIRAVNVVHNPQTGYDAARDCRIILTSPVYIPSSASSEGWSNALRLWQNIDRSLPAADNLMVCFRETWPQQQGGTRWVDAFNQAIADAGGPPLGLWIYFAGGADHWLNDYPFVGTPAMNALFEGAAGIYSACGDLCQEPQQVLNAEYAWNVRSDGFWLEPRTHDEASRTWQEVANNLTRPPALFGADGWLERICKRLYGQAAETMVRFYSDCEPLRPIQTGEQSGGPAAFDAVVGITDAAQRPYLPMAYEKVYAMPVHWRRLALDSKTWPERIGNEVYLQRLEKCGITRAELHSRLKRQWDLVARLSRQGHARVQEALLAGIEPGAAQDLEFLARSLEVASLLSGALSEFHRAKQAHHAQVPEPGQVAEHLDRAARLSGQAARLAAESFPTISDPAGAEVGGLRVRIEQLREIIGQMRKR